MKIVGAPVLNPNHSFFRFEILMIAFFLCKLAVIAVLAIRKTKSGTKIKFDQIAKPSARRKSIVMTCNNVNNAFTLGFGSEVARIVNLLEYSPGIHGNFGKIIIQ